MARTVLELVNEPISDKAIGMLKKIVNSDNGRLILLYGLYQWHLRFGKESISISSSREEAELRQTIKELMSEELIEVVYLRQGKETSSMVYAATLLGYQLAEHWTQNTSRSTRAQT